MSEDKAKARTGGIFMKTTQLNPSRRALSPQRSAKWLLDARWLFSGFGFCGSLTLTRFYVLCKSALRGSDLGADVTLLYEPSAHVLPYRLALDTALVAAPGLSRAVQRGT